MLAQARTGEFNGTLDGVPPLRIEPLPIAAQRSGLRPLEGTPPQWGTLPQFPGAGRLVGGRLAAARGAIPTRGAGKGIMSDESRGPYRPEYEDVFQLRPRRS
jgi:hypothetical protein